jgi:crotonobetainyl-CoA:carnitine CoA-transferase CaiB-like acyl-CoA transferase
VDDSLRPVHPLGGVRVVELSGGVAGALCTKLLAEAGADVAHLERDRLDASWSRFLDRDKHLVADAEVTDADLVVTDDRSACDALLAASPHAIVLCLTPFGAGPYEGFASSDAVLSALCGLADATPGFPDHVERPDDPPVQSLAPLAEAAAAVTAANAALAALLARDGGGAHARLIEVGALEAAVSMLTYEWAVTSYSGAVRGRRPGPADLEPNCYVACRDGTVVLVAFGEAQWHGLVETMDEPDWAADPRFATGESRTANWRELHRRLSEWASGVGGRTILDRAQAHGVPCAPCLTLRETLASDHVAATGAIRLLEDGPVPADPAVVDGVRRVHVPAAHRESALWRAAATPERPLAGIRVLDLTQYVAGPFAGQCLAALGAEVVLVETSTHAPTRGFGPFAGEPAHDAGATFNHHNRGKRSVLVNLKTEQGAAILRRLVEASDVVLENFSRRAAEKLGLTHEALREIRPDIVLGSISGLGRRGPWGGFVALHSGVILLSGLADATRDASGRPRLVGSTYPDPLTGAYLALLVQQALAVRAQTGEGCHVEVSMLDVALTCMGGLVPAALRDGELPTHPVRFFPTAEPGRYVAVESDGEHDCSALTRREAMAALQAEGLPAAAVFDAAEVMADEHLCAAGFVVADTHSIAAGRPLPAVPWRFDGARPALGPAPLRGEATREVLEQIAGVGPADADELEADGVLV